MEFRPNNPIDDKTLGSKAQSSINNASNKTGVEGAGLLWMMVSGTIFFIFVFAPVVLRIFFRKDIGVKALGIITILGAYLWTRVVYVGMSLYSLPCEVYKSKCVVGSWLWVMVTPLFEIIGLESTGGYNLGEFLYPWNIWNPDFPSFLPLFGTIILVFGMVHYFGNLIQSNRKEIGLYDRGKSIFIGSTKNWEWKSNTLDLNKLEQYFEIVVIIGLAFIALVVGDVILGLAFLFAFICLKIEDFKTWTKERDVIIEQEEGKRIGKYVKEITQNTEPIKTKPTKGGKNIAQI